MVAQASRFLARLTVSSDGISAGLGQLAVDINLTVDNRDIARVVLAVDERAAAAHGDAIEIHLWEFSRAPGYPCRRAPCPNSNAE